MIRAFRWLAYLPVAFLASVLAGAAASWAGDLVGGSAWYVWVISGAASAWVFFFTAFRIAPALVPWVKWASVGVVGAVGAMAALGPLLTGRHPIASLAGVVMLVFAVHSARLPLEAVHAEVTGASNP